MPDFALANAEFDRQANILDALLLAVDVNARQQDLVAPANAISVLAVIPAGGQNTMAAAAIVLLAAHFEEYVRQQVAEYAKSIVDQYAHLENSLKETLVESYWRAGSSKLTRIRPRGSFAWAAEAEPLLRGLIEFPVSGNILAFQSSYICEHENNMRWDTVVELTSRIGIKSLSDLMYKSKSLRDELENPKRNQMMLATRRKMNAFYELRNGIIHSIAQNSGVGATIFRGWSEFFRLFTTAFSNSLSDAFVNQEKDIKRRQIADIPR